VAPLFRRLMPPNAPRSPSRRPRDATREPARAQRAAQGARPQRSLAPSSPRHGGVAAAPMPSKRQQADGEQVRPDSRRRTPRSLSKPNVAVTRYRRKESVRYVECTERQRAVRWSRHGAFHVKGSVVPLPRRCREHRRASPRAGCVAAVPPRLPTSCASQKRV
jgi:hypothetical protein